MPDHSATMRGCLQICGQNEPVLIGDRLDHPGRHLALPLSETMATLACFAKDDAVVPSSSADRPTEADARAALQSALDSKFGGGAWQVREATTGDHVFRDNQWIDVDNAWSYTFRIEPSLSADTVARVRRDVATTHEVYVATRVLVSQR